MVFDGRHALDLVEEASHDVRDPQDAGEAARRFGCFGAQVVLALQALHVRGAAQTMRN